MTQEKNRRQNDQNWLHSLSKVLFEYFHGDAINNLSQNLGFSKKKQKTLNKYSVDYFSIGDRVT